MKGVHCQTSMITTDTRARVGSDSHNIPLAPNARPQPARIPNSLFSISFQTSPTLTGVAMTGSSSSERITGCVRVIRLKE